MKQDAEGVTATFADGRIERGALLIAADGGRSVVRRHVYGESNLTPRYSGFTIRRAITDVDPDVLPAGTARTFVGMGQHFAVFPVGANRVYWGLMQRRPAGERDAIESRRERVLEALEGYPEVTRMVVSATPSEAISRTDICDRDVQPTWRRGRVVLIGAAAHMTTPFLGQGAGISMEDSVVLAKELSLTDGLRDQRTLERALDSFQASRFRRCRSIVLTARRWGMVWSLSNPNAVGARNALLHAVPKVVWKKVCQSTINYDVRGPTPADPQTGVWS